MDVLIFWLLFWRRVMLAIDMAPKIDARIIGYGSLARSPVVSPSACFFLAAMRRSLFHYVSLQEKTYKNHQIPYEFMDLPDFAIRIFPDPRLHLCIKVTQEPPAGLKASLHRTYTTMITQETLDKAHSWIQLYDIIIFYCGDVISSYIHLMYVCVLIHISQCSWTCRTFFLWYVFQ